MFFFTLVQNAYACSDTTFFDIRVWSFGIFPTIKEYGFMKAMKIWGTDEWWNLDTTKLYYLKVFKYDSNMFWFFTVLAQGIDTLMNTIVFIDLYLTLSDPFKSREGRRKYYQSSIFIVVCTITFGLYYFWDQQFGRSESTLTTFIVYQNIMGFVGLTTFVLVIRRLTMNGTSADLRRTVIKKYIYIFLLYIYITSLNTYFIINKNMISFTDADWSLTIPNLLSTEKIFVYFYYLAGFTRALLRFKEPFIYEQFKAELKIFMIKTKCRKNNRKRISDVEKP